MVLLISGRTALVEWKAAQREDRENCGRWPSSRTGERELSKKRRFHQTNRRAMAAHFIRFLVGFVVHQSSVRGSRCGAR
jgi:hypothetical protein